MADDIILRAIEKLVLMGDEATYGTDPTLTADTHAFLSEDISIKGFAGQRQQRNMDQPGMGGTKSYLSPRHVTGSFKTALIGGGAAGDPAPYAAALLAGQFAEAITVDTSAVYSLVSSDYGSSALYFHKDRRRQQVLGIRGGVGFSFMAGQIPYLNFNFAGLYAGPTDTAMPTGADFSAFTAVEPELVSDEETLTVTLNGVAMVLHAAEIQPPSNFGYVNRPGQEAVKITGRRNYTARLTVFQKTLATFNPHALAEADTLVPLVIEHGATAGNIANVSAPNAQIVDIDEGEQDGDATWVLDLALTSTDDGDDDLEFTLT